MLQLIAIVNNYGIIIIITLDLYSPPLGLLEVHIAREIHQHIPKHMHQHKLYTLLMKYSRTPSPPPIKDGTTSLQTLLSTKDTCPLRLFTVAMVTYRIATMHYLQLYHLQCLRQ